MKGDRERCVEAGMDGYLPKPFRPRDLADLLEKVRSGAFEPEPVNS
jgi:CheY-like chemotaxis protein